MDIDESQYGEFARLVLNGGIPYHDCIGEKPFFMYGFFILCFGVFGENNYFMVHWITILWVAASALGLLMLGTWTISRQFGWMIALLYLCLSTFHEMKIISTNGETLFNLPLIWAVALIFHPCKRHEWLLWIGIGSLIGIAAEFRYQALVLIPLFVAYYWFYRKPIALPWILLGFLVVSLIPGILLYLWGAWQDYYFWNWIYNVQYTEWGVKTIPVSKGILRSLLFVVATSLAWYLMVWYIVKMLRHKKRDRESSHRRFSLALSRNIHQGNHHKRVFWVAFGWLVLGCCTIPLGLRFYTHYFLIIIPPIAIISALGWLYIRRGYFLKYHRNVKWIGLLLVGLSMGFLIPRLNQDITYSIMCQVDPTTPYTSGVMPEQKAIGRYIAEHSTTENRIFVWGFATPIYVYADRLGSTRFPWSDFLVGRIPGSPTGLDPSYDTWRKGSFVEQSWSQLWKDFEEHPPLYIVDTSSAGFHEYAKYPMEKYSMIQLGEKYGLLEFMAAQYHYECSIHEVRLYRRNAVPWLGEQS